MYLCNVYNIDLYMLFCTMASTCIIDVFLLCFISGIAVGQIVKQADLDDIAKTLLVRVKVEDNLQFDGHKHLFRVTLENNGSKSLSGTNWKIYLYSYFVLEADHIVVDNNYVLPEGYVLEKYKLRVNHVTGCLYSLTPVEGFPAIYQNEKRVIKFFASLWAATKTDIPPNWYITSDGLSPRIITSTSGEFVEDFTEPFQWKRSRSDLYNPYTPLDRFNRYKLVKEHPKMKIAIPTPKTIYKYDESDSLDLSGEVYIVSTGLQNEATYLANKTGFKLADHKVNGRYNIVLIKNNSVKSSDGYELKTDSTEKEITIIGKSEAGIFYGIQTLLSMISDHVNKVPSVNLYDEPRYEFRGMHIDIARNFQTKSTLLKMIETMATYKLNKLHLHATDDEGWRIQIKDLPELTEVGSKRCHDLEEKNCLLPQLGSGPDTSTSGSGFLTISDYIELLEYAKARHIQVIPEIDMPGHARAAIKSMEKRYNDFLKTDKQKAEKYRLFDPDDHSKYLTNQFFADGSLTPCLNSTFRFIDKVIVELKAMHDQAKHPLTIFHFGGDEIARNALSNSTTCQKLGYTGRDAKTQLKQLFVERVSEIARKYKLNLQGWEDGFIEGEGKIYERNIFKNAEVISNAWDNVWEWGEGRRTYNFANAGYKVVMSHATHLYFDHPYEPDPEERGLYWATRFADDYKTFRFKPDTLYENIGRSVFGAKLKKDKICATTDDCPALQEPQNIIGMQGHLWSETAFNAELFYYMIFPRMLALAERAWHKASWENVSSSMTRDQLTDDDWADFTETVGYRELKRLDELGVTYRIPPPGARVVGNIATIESEYKALKVEYSQDNGQSWEDVPNTWNLPNKFKMLLRTKSADENRRSRAIPFNPVNQEMVDYMSEKLDIKFDVLDNLFDDNRFSQRVTIRNAGNVDILPGDWSIFFYHIRAINNLNPLPLPECGMLLSHVTGSLYKLTPIVDVAKALKVSAKIQCEFNAKYWSVAVTDNMPDWYVSSDGTEPKIIKSTQGGSLEFVGPYDTKNKWKRYKADKYDPFLPRTRYTLNSDVDDFGADSIVVKEGTYIIPSPVSIDVNTEESVTINPGDGWVVEENLQFSKELKIIAEFYNISVLTKKQTSKCIRAVYKHVSKFPDQLAKTEGYFLRVIPSLQEIRIEANDPMGIFYAFQSLKQLSIKDDNGVYRLYKSSVGDAPRFDFRGLFLDVGRNFFPKEDIMILLDFMAEYKLNKLQLHMSEDEGWRLEIPGLEELTKVGSQRCHDLKERHCIAPQLGSGPFTNTSGSGYYTMADYRDILKYANERHIKVIPEFDMPGHARAAIVAMKERERVFKLQNNISLAEEFKLYDPDDRSQYMSFQWFTDNAINPCIDSTYTFVERIVKEVKAMHAGIQDLEIFSFGGDEVAKGAWEKSPLCQQFIKLHNKINSTIELKQYFADRVSRIVSDHDLDVSAWEDGLMQDKAPFDTSQLVSKKSKVYASAWDIWERGGGDRTYRLANAGYKVILAFATHLYFDHPYEPDPSERGYYWATRYTDTRKAFGFIPDDIYANADFKRSGEPLTLEDVCGGPTCYELKKPENIAGMMGLVWSETSRTREHLHDRFFPRMLALAERAWHKASWEDIKNKHDRTVSLNKDWTIFANRLGHGALKRLENLNILYRVPVPGAKGEGDVLKTNTAFPGMTVEYSQDKMKTWRTGEIKTSSSDVIPETYLRTKSLDGKRASRTIVVKETTSSAVNTTFAIQTLVLTILLHIFT